MGGRKGGATAAAMATAKFETDCTGNEPTTAAAAETFVKQVILDTKTDVMKAAADPALSRMGSTMVTFLVVGNRWFAGSSGDSRLYHLPHAGTLVQITHDHSAGQRFVDQGAMTLAQAKASRFWHSLWQCVGRTTCDPDGFKGQVQPGDRFLVCSDGIDKHLDEPTIQRILLSSDDPDVVAQALNDAANADGGSDNIAVLVVFAEPTAQPTAVSVP